MPTDLDVLILGSGTSAGIPVIGCDCPTCGSDDPRDQRLRTSGALRFTDAEGHPRVLLIDTSPDLRQQALTHDLRRCDAILFTHNHVDHTFGLDEVRRFNVLMDHPIDVLADEHTMTSLHRVFQHIFRRHENVNDSFVASLISHVVEPFAAFERYGLRVTPIPLLHGRQPILGYRFDRTDGTIRADDPLPLAWCTDVSAIPPDAWPMLEGLDTLVLDMLRFRRHPTHLTVDQATETAQRIGARETVFVHMNHEIRHADVDPTLPAGMSLGYDGRALGGASG